jgi:hypothetical protein
MNFAEFMRGEKPQDTGPKSEYPKYKGFFLRHNKIREVIRGDREGLMRGFLWGGTPQGNAHWDAVWCGDANLTESDIDYLHFLLEQPERG